MNVIRFIACLLLLSGCTSICSTNNKSSCPSIESSLSDINQKVSGSYVIENVPDDFNEVQYKENVVRVCYNNPACKVKAEKIFDSYIVKARKVNDILSVMICDKNDLSKIMEDFSCNNLIVEIKSWQFDDKLKCDFDSNPSIVINKYCQK